MINFVTGMPRSRTAWLSELMTVHGHSFAYHEANMGLSVEQYIDKLQGRFEHHCEQHIVDCSSGVMYQWEDLKHFLEKGSRVLVINRDLTEVRTSFEKFHATFPVQHHFESMWGMILEAWWKFMEDIQYAGKDKVRFLDYELIDDETQMREAFHWLLPMVPWKRERFHELKKKMIVQNLEGVLRSLETNAG